MVQEQWDLSDSDAKKLMKKSKTYQEIKYKSGATVYFEQRSDNEDDLLPLLFDAGGGELFPTVYAMWKMPSLLPPLEINAEVTPFIFRGADLMLQGVYPESVRDAFDAGQRRCVIARGNPLPLAVGSMLLSSDEVKINGINKGVAVTKAGDLRFNFS